MDGVRGGGGGREGEQVEGKGKSELFIMRSFAWLERFLPSPFMLTVRELITANNIVLRELGSSPINETIMIASCGTSNGCTETATVLFVSTFSIVIFFLYRVLDVSG